jgi:hypothetical protein
MQLRHAPRARSRSTKRRRSAASSTGSGSPGPRKPVTKPEEFGKPQPPIPVPGGEINQITSTVIEFALTPRRKALFVLDERPGVETTRDATIRECSSRIRPTDESHDRDRLSSRTTL